MFNMKGDYYRYLAEFKSDAEREEAKVSKLFDLPYETLWDIVRMLGLLDMTRFRGVFSITKDYPMTSHAIKRLSQTPIVPDVFPYISFPENLVVGSINKTILVMELYLYSQTLLLVNPLTNHQLEIPARPSQPHPLLLLEDDANLNNYAYGLGWARKASETVVIQLFRGGHKFLGIVDRKLCALSRVMGLNSVEIRALEEDKSGRKWNLLHTIPEYNLYDSLRSIFPKVLTCTDAGILFLLNVELFTPIDESADAITTTMANVTKAIQDQVNQSIDAMNESIKGVCTRQDFICAEMKKLSGEASTSTVPNRANNSKVDAMEENQKVKLVFMHLYDKALAWHQQYSKMYGEEMLWEVYVEALLKRFCSTYENPMTDLKNISQKEGYVQVYIDAFDVLMTKVEVPESQAVSFFLGGLDKDIEMSVRMFKPQTLADAYCLSKLQEANNNVSKK
ncbi:reverse transcriptase [Tanacetum coccineum]